MQPARREHPFDFNFRTARHYRQQRPLFDDMDLIRGSEALVDYTLGEVEEAHEEVNKVEGYDPTKVIDELNDIYNMWVALANQKFGQNFKPSDHLLYVNGDGKDSDSFERLKATIEDIKDDARAVVASLELLWSIAQYAVDRNTEQMAADIISTYNKVSLNYPTELYTGKDPVTGASLTDEQKEAVFTHTTKGLKMIRADVQRTLKRSDIPPFRENLVDWQNSSSALAEIQNKLASRSSTPEESKNGLLLPTPEVTISITQNKGILFSQPR